MQIRSYTTLRNLPEVAWTQLIGNHFPFAEYQYLLAMEYGHCVGESAGWEPYYLTAWERDRLVGATYLYLKDNSYGEYIFDWEWAHAYMMHGKQYYPKLTCAAPFTPATGAKLLVHPEADYSSVSQVLVNAARELSQELRCSSLHYLFIPKSEIPVFEAMGFGVRYSYQFHWKNNDYSDFAAFVDTLKRKRRKEILRERRLVREQGINIQTFTGDALLPEHSDVMYDFYLSTVYKKGGHDYLSREFFQYVFRNMKSSIVLVLAEWGGEWVAGAINYRKGDCMYGRYWGCLEKFKHLHFELCYYQPIDYAISHQIHLFEAGAQGSHKIQRGFLPELTYSAHWIRNSQFRHAIGRFLEEERQAIVSSFKDSEERMPYKAQVTLGDP